MKDLLNFLCWVLALFVAGVIGYLIIYKDLPAWLRNHPKFSRSALLATIGTIPVVGGWVKDLVEPLLPDEKDPNHVDPVTVRREQERYESIYQALTAFFASLAEDLKHDAEKLRDLFDGESDSERQLDDMSGSTQKLENVVRKITVQVAETDDQRKRDAYRRVFRDVLIAEDRSYDVVSDIVNCLGELDRNDMMILSILANPERAQATFGAPINLRGSCDGLDAEEILDKLLGEWDCDAIRKTLSDLAQEHVIFDCDHSPPPSGDGVETLRCMLTPFGDRLIAYLADD